MIQKQLLTHTLLTIYLILFGALCHAQTPPLSEHGTAEIGRATYYSDRYQGKRTASGEIYDKHKLTAVHRDYPFGTVLRVTNLNNNRSVVVKVNDRAKLNGSHVLDLSKQAAQQLNFIHAGWAKVKVEALHPGRA